MSVTWFESRKKAILLEAIIPLPKRGNRVFESDAQTSAGRYQVRLVSGEMRQKSHQKKVQEALDEGSARGWRLVSATTTNASGAYVTGVYWDTTPDR